MKLGLLQLSSSDDPVQNLAEISAQIRAAHHAGAQIVATPEASNCISLSGARQAAQLQPETADQSLSALRALAQELGIWIALGSLAIKTDDPDGRYANRSYVIGAEGQIAARYDKLHMFDVQLSEAEAYHESKRYRPGRAAVICDTPWARLGLSICYDLRFGALYSALARAGAQVLMVPAAFAPETGAAHWQVLLRARAIETGCFVIAAAQTGTHPAQEGRARQTYGHSMVVAPWGEVLLDAGTAPGLHLLELDLAQVEVARRKIPTLDHAREFEGPRHDL